METPLNGRFVPGLIDRLAAMLRRGAVAVLPTDTIYGFHGAADRPAAVDRIRRLKGRRSGGFILLASSPAMADGLISRWPLGSRTILERLWPGPVTAILPASGSVEEALRPRGRVAVRVPRHAGLAALIDAVRIPLVSTSVNRPGEQPLEHIAQIRERFPGCDAYLGRHGPGARAASTVIDFTGPSPAIVREGAGCGRVRAVIGQD